MSARQISSDVYVDTSVFVNTLVDGMAQSEVCFAAYEYLVTHRTTVYISHLTRLEFLEAIRSLANKELLPRAFKAQFELDQWENPVIRQQWLEFWASKFDEILGTFNVVYELPFRQRTWHDIPRLMANTPLRAYDAFHLAIALNYQIPEFWTTDADFRKCSGIRVQILRSSI